MANTSINNTIDLVDTAALGAPSPKRETPSTVIQTTANKPWRLYDAVKTSLLFTFIVLFISALSYASAYFIDHRNDVAERAAYSAMIEKKEASIEKSRKISERLYEARPDIKAAAAAYVAASAEQPAVAVQHLPSQNDFSPNAKEVEARYKANQAQKDIKSNLVQLSASGK